MQQPARIETDARFIEYDHERKIRHRNKTYYRVLHWPIWIFVFFIAPGPLTFDLFARGFDARMVALADRSCWSPPASRGCADGCPDASRRPTSSDSPRIVRIRCIAASATRRPGARSSRLPRSTSPD